MVDVNHIAFHEAGHCVATVLGFRQLADWLPHPAPALPVRYVEISDGSGRTVGSNIYDPSWGLAPRYLPLMQQQVVNYLAGGIAEAIHRGEREKNEVLAFAQDHCGVNTDLQRAGVVLDQLCALTGRRHDPDPYAKRAMGLLSANWKAVELVAWALAESGRVEGRWVTRLIDYA